MQPVCFRWSISNKMNTCFYAVVEIDRTAEICSWFILCDRKFLGIPITQKGTFFYVTGNINYDINSTIDENVRKP